MGPFTVAFEHAGQLLPLALGSPGGMPGFGAAREMDRVEEVTDEPLYLERVCGIDIGKAGMEACIRVPSEANPRRRAHETRSFGTTRNQVLALADWLACWGVTDVVMEATGDYVRREGA